MKNLHYYSKIAKAIFLLIPDLELTEQDIEHLISEKGLLYFATNSGKKVAELFETVLLVACLSNGGLNENTLTESPQSKNEQTDSLAE